METLHPADTVRTAAELLREAAAAYGDRPAIRVGEGTEGVGKVGRLDENTFPIKNLFLVKCQNFFNSHGGVEMQFRNMSAWIVFLQKIPRFTRNQGYE